MLSMHSHAWRTRSGHGRRSWPVHPATSPTAAGGRIDNESGKGGGGQRRRRAATGDARKTRLGLGGEEGVDGRGEGRAEGDAGGGGAAAGVRLGPLPHPAPHPGANGAGNAFLPALLEHDMYEAGGGRRDERKSGEESRRKGGKGAPLGVSNVQVVGHGQPCGRTGPREVSVRGSMGGPSGWVRQGVRGVRGEGKGAPAGEPLAALLAEPGGADHADGSGGGPEARTADGPGQVDLVEAAPGVSGGGADT